MASWVFSSCTPVSPVYPHVAVPPSFLGPDERSLAVLERQTRNYYEGVADSKGRDVEGREHVEADECIVKPHFNREHASGRSGLLSSGALRCEEKTQLVHSEMAENTTSGSGSEGLKVAQSVALCPTEARSAAKGSRRNVDGSAEEESTALLYIGRCDEVLSQPMLDDEDQASDFSSLCPSSLPARSITGAETGLQSEGDDTPKGRGALRWCYCRSESFKPECLPTQTSGTPPEPPRAAMTRISASPIPRGSAGHRGDHGDVPSLAPCAVSLPNWILSMVRLRRSKQESLTSSPSPKFRGVFHCDTSDKPGDRTEASEIMKEGDKQQRKARNRGFCSFWYASPGYLWDAFCGFSLCLVGIVPLPRCWARGVRKVFKRPGGITAGSRGTGKHDVQTRMRDKKDRAGEFPGSHQRQLILPVCSDHSKKETAPLDNAVGTAEASPVKLDGEYGRRHSGAEETEEEDSGTLSKERRKNEEQRPSVPSVTRMHPWCFLSSHVPYAPSPPCASSPLLSPPAKAIVGAPSTSLLSSTDHSFCLEGTSRDREVNQTRPAGEKVVPNGPGELRPADGDHGPSLSPEPAAAHPAKQITSPQGNVERRRLTDCTTAEECGSSPCFSAGQEPQPGSELQAPGFQLNQETETPVPRPARSLLSCLSEVCRCPLDLLRRRRKKHSPSVARSDSTAQTAGECLGTLCVPEIAFPRQDPEHRDGRTRKRAGDEVGRRERRSEVLKEWIQSPHVKVLGSVAAVSFLVLLGRCLNPLVCMYGLLFLISVLALGASFVRLIHEHGVVIAMPPEASRVLEDARLLDLLYVQLSSGRHTFYISRLVALLFASPTPEEALALLEGWHPTLVKLLTTRGVLNAFPKRFKRVFYGSRRVRKERTRGEGAWRQGGQYGGASRDEHELRGEGEEAEDGQRDGEEERAEEGFDEEGNSCGSPSERVDKAAEDRQKAKSTDDLSRGQTPLATSVSHALGLSEVSGRPRRQVPLEPAPPLRHRTVLGSISPLQSPPSTAAPLPRSSFSDPCLLGSTRAPEQSTASSHGGNISCIAFASFSHEDSPAHMDTFEETGSSSFPDQVKRSFSVPFKSADAHKPVLSRRARALCPRTYNASFSDECEKDVGHGGTSGEERGDHMRQQYDGALLAQPQASLETPAASPVSSRSSSLVSDGSLPSGSQTPPWAREVVPPLTPAHCFVPSFDAYYKGPEAKNSKLQRKACQVVSEMGHRIGECEEIFRGRTWHEVKVSLYVYALYQS